jgi:4-hydroxybenzoate polyprenyltransferase
LHDPAVHTPQSTLARLKLFLALSRVPHGLLDMATPAVAALLWYGAFPPLRIIVLGVITTFAGYTAVYALNDLMDYRADQQRFEQGRFAGIKNDLDAIFVRHPLAAGLLPFKQGLFWAIGWAMLALVGALLLNPFCMVIFLAACLLETIYCLMWRSSYLKVLISGAVKTSGAVAAVFAVDAHPALPFLVLLFLWLFFWEMGGQNIPNDWADMEEDTRLRATTIPVRFGPAYAKVIIFVSLVLVVALNGILLSSARIEARSVGIAASLGAGVYLLLIPALRLYRGTRQSHVLGLFNRASYYPLSLLAVVTITIMI